MKNFVSMVIGLSIGGYFIWVVIQIIQILIGNANLEWQDISGHIIFVGVLFFLAAVGHFFGRENKDDSDNNTQTSDTESKDAPPEENNTREKQPQYNPYIDKLEFAVYRQSFKTWWYDSDGDKQHKGTVYAHLRFYEDGQVIGVRDSVMPKIDIPESYTMKGKWELQDNIISFNLDKINDVDDSVFIYISEEDRREMKYYGEIADDNSLIKAGNHKGVISKNTITTGGFTFKTVPHSTLIITADEDVCEELCRTIKKHHKVIDAFEDSGYWYSNGETGPEWFTVHIRTHSTNQTEIEQAVDKELKKMGQSAGNSYWS